MITRRLTALSMIAALTGLTLITASAIVTPAFAIKRFFNCMIDEANKNGKLTVDDVNLCYDKEYHTGPFATHTHSHPSGGTGSGSSASSSSE